FNPGGVQLSAQGVAVLRSVAGDIFRNYPEQRIGIEGHTDGAPVASPRYPTSHHLSVAQATAIYEALRQASGAPAEQLFVIGHGANHPLVSNGTEAGRQRNRRVELVVYPESIRRR
ncbi:MAG: OmpA family protein, partial [Planctomycetota bacterium]